MFHLVRPILWPISLQEWHFFLARFAICFSGLLILCLLHFKVPVIELSIDCETKVKSKAANSSDEDVDVIAKWICSSGIDSSNISYYHDDDKEKAKQMALRYLFRPKLTPEDKENL